MSAAQPPKATGLPSTVDGRPPSKAATQRMDEDFIDYEDRMTRLTVQRLETLKQDWADHLELFSFSGALLLVDRNIWRWHDEACKCGQVPSSAILWRASYSEIHNGGGDPGTCIGWTPTGGTDVQAP